MSEIGDEDFDLDVLMRRIRMKVESRKAASSAARAAQVPSSITSDTAPQPASAPPPLSLSRLSAAETPVPSNKRYTSEELLRYHDEEFLRYAYHAILRRDPDGRGFASFLDELRSGRVSRIEVLGRIRYSPEGRAAAVPVEGLALRFAVRRARRIPVFGRVIAVLQYVGRLPEVVGSLERLEAANFRRDRDMRCQIDANGVAVESAIVSISKRWSDQLVKTESEVARASAGLSTVERSLADLNSSLGRIRSELAGKADKDALDRVADQTVAKADRAEVQKLASNLVAKADLVVVQKLTSDVDAKANRGEVQKLTSNVDAKADRVEVRKLASDLLIKADLVVVQKLASGVDAKADRAEVNDLARRISTLIEDLAARLEPLKAGADPRFDDFYQKLEERFRGAREDIASRVEVYLPFVAAASAGTELHPAVDLGCGRGEWLEVLATHNYVGRGVDASAVMVAGCNERGLQVDLGDALNYLKASRPSSFGAITAMHVVEHLRFGETLLLVEEALRVLRPGGVLIIETPNPENVSVGTNTFYLDPTHQRPIPPPLLRFIAEHLGFVDIEILPLHPRAASEWPVEAESHGTEHLNQLFFGAQDYAIVARKPSAKSG